MADTVLGMGNSHITCMMRALADMPGCWDTKKSKPTLLRIGSENLPSPVETLTAAEMLGNTKGDRPRFRRNARFAQRFKQSSSYSAQTSADKVSVLTPQFENFILSKINRTNPKAIFMLPKGNEYGRFSLVNFPTPLTLSDGPDSVPIPIMRAQLRKIAEEGALLFFRHVKDVTQTPVFMVPPPPPIFSNEHLAENPGQFGERIKTLGIAAPELRLQLYTLYCDILKEEVIKAGGHYIDTPDQLHKDGYLLEEHLRNDPLHANKAFGASMLSHIQTTIDDILGKA